MKSVTLKGTKRSDLGTNAAKQLRRDGHVPCVVYGGEENVHFSASMKDLKGLIYTPEFSKVVVEVDGGSYETIIKDHQFDPVTDKLMHLDFQQLIAGRKVKTEIPIVTQIFRSHQLKYLELLKVLKLKKLLQKLLQKLAKAKKVLKLLKAETVMLKNKIVFQI